MSWVARMDDLFQALRNKNISIIVPVFNEARNILKNLDLLVSEVAPYFENYEIIVISDGSTDGTNGALSTQSHAGVRTVFLDKNRGKGFAVRRGFLECKGDFVLFIDGDMELHPREIRVFLGLQALYDADIVIGSKRHPQSNIIYPWTRRALSFIFQMIINHLFDLDVTDTQVGIKLFRRDVVDAVKQDLSVDRYGFDLELLALARRRGFKKMLEAPIRLDYFWQDERRSKIMDLVHIFKVGYHVMSDTCVVYRKLRNARKTG